MSNGNRKPDDNPIFDEIEKKAADQSRFIKAKEGQPLILEFFPKEIEIKQVDFQKNGELTDRVNFTVKDATGKIEGVKEISFGVKTAVRINKLLKRGINKLEIIRTGSGLNTKYDFIPA
jgi:hypothetical protein